MQNVVVYLSSKQPVKLTLGGYANIIFLNGERKHMKERPFAFDDIARRTCMIMHFPGILFH